MDTKEHRGFCPQCGFVTIDRVHGEWCPRCRGWIVFYTGFGLSYWRVARPS